MSEPIRKETSTRAKWNLPEDTHSVDWWQYVAILTAERLCTLYQLAGAAPEVELSLELFKGSVEVTAELTPKMFKLTGACHRPAGHVPTSPDLADLPVRTRPV